MTDIERIRNQLTHSIKGEPWHGPSLFDLLEDVTPEQALARPIEKGHTIWELVLHIDTWMKETAARLAGNGRALPPDEDWPPQPEEADPDNWRDSKARLIATMRDLIEMLDEQVQSRLDDPIAEGFDPVYHALYGVIQHNTYHGGQIMLLKKLV